MIGLGRVPPRRKTTPTPAMVAFGQRVRDRRTDLGLSMEQAADVIGIHWTHLGMVERGQRSSRIDNVLKIAAGLQTTPGALLDGLPLR